MGRRAQKKKIAKLLVHNERPSLYPIFKKRTNAQREDDKPKPRKQPKMKDILQGEKFMWFKKNLMNILKPKKNKKTKQLKKTQVKEIVEKYLHRYDFELEHLEKIKSMKPKLYRKLQDREGAIKRVTKLEKRMFEHRGIEIPRLSDPKTVKFLKNWDGHMQLISYVKMTTFSKKNLEAIAAESVVKTKPVTIADPESVVESISELSLAPNVDPNVDANVPNVEPFGPNVEQMEPGECGEVPPQVAEGEINMDIV